jgi:hypothetical protein
VRETDYLATPWGAVIKSLCWPPPFKNENPLGSEANLMNRKQRVLTIIVVILFVAIVIYELSEYSRFRS